MRRIRAIPFLAAATLCLTLAGSAVAADAPVAAAPAAGSFAQKAQPLLQKYCYECHGPTKQKAQLRYDQIAGYRIEDRLLWANVHEKVTDGGMPPEDHPQPTDAERRQLLSWIEQTAAAARKANGVGSTRRLNRRELSAALQDVTGLAV